MPRPSLLTRVRLLLLLCLCWWALLKTTPVAAADAAPTGAIHGPFAWNTSQIYPGTQRHYWLYVPQQYTGEQPACVLVVQDGLNRANEWQLPTTMDELIHAKKMPVTIGIFIDPGVVPALDPNAQPRYNRSFEYDALGDAYARFLLDEILPEVGRTYRLSTDPNDRAIAGASSGAICAFTVAWERPDAFRRVFSTIGTYVGLRGGDSYPTLIRKTQPKPIRVFLEDGSHDLNIYGGDWFLANQSMLSALQFSRYDVNHAWGEGGHNGEHGRQVAAEALTWLWRDYPQPIQVQPDQSHRRTDLLVPGESWQVVSAGHEFTEGPASNGQGELFFTDIPQGKIHKVARDGTVSLFAAQSPGVNGLMFGPDGWLYACQHGNRQIVRYSASGVEEVVVRDAPSNDLVTLLPRGGYYTDPENHRVWFVDASGQRQVVDDQLDFPNGIIASPDHQWLYVSDTHSRFVYSYQIQPNGQLAARQRFGHLHVPDDAKDSGADGMTVDTLGRLYVTTRSGLQVLDPLGRVQFIFDKPQSAWLSNVTFGGPQLDTLYVTCGDKVYRQRVKAQGLLPWNTVQPPKPQL